MVVQESSSNLFPVWQNCVPPFSFPRHQHQYFNSFPRSVKQILISVFPTIFSFVPQTRWRKLLLTTFRERFKFANSTMKNNSFALIARGFYLCTFHSRSGLFLNGKWSALSVVWTTQVLKNKLSIFGFYVQNDDPNLIVIIKHISQAKGLGIIQEWLKRLHGVAIVFVALSFLLLLCTDHLI